MFFKSKSKQNKIIEEKQYIVHNLSKNITPIYGNDYYDDSDGGTVLMFPGTVSLYVNITYKNLSKKLMINEFPCSIGRSKKIADIIISDIQISRNHCVIENFSGKLFVIDNNSKNGISINNKKIKSQSPVLISVGDTVKIGQSYFEILKIG